MRLPDGCTLDGSRNVVSTRFGDDVIEGIDELTGDAIELGGAYGILTTIVLPATSAHALLIDPRAGDFEGAIAIDDNIIDVSSQEQQQAVYAGDLPSTITLMSPGGSSLPL